VQYVPSLSDYCFTTDKGDMKNAQNHEVLICQIQESNKAYLNMSKKVTKLEKELSQRRKCDAAAQAFFVVAYGKQDNAERQ